MMEQFRTLVPEPTQFLPLVIVLLAAALLLGGARAILRHRARIRGAEFPFGSQVAMLALTALVIVGVVLALPVSETTRGQLLSLLGLVLTGMIAFSSTTFVANAMAGLMLRAVGNFRAGDWLRVGEQFGRVTERGLFHTEIQTEDRDLATIPNLYLVTNPVVVVRESGTIVSVSLSLGYDQHHAELETLLAEAARAAGLEDPFVQILDLGDFAVTYRVAGFLTEVKQLLTARSRLRGYVLDTLHTAGIEIVSPSFMNQRRLGEATRILPSDRAPSPPPTETTSPEAMIFDKADEKASLEDMSAERQRLQKEIEALEEAARTGTSQEKADVQAEITRRRSRIDAISAALERAPDAER